MSDTGDLGDSCLREDVEMGRDGVKLELAKHERGEGGSGSRYEGGSHKRR